MLFSLIRLFLFGIFQICFCFATFAQGQSSWFFTDSLGRKAGILDADCIWPALLLGCSPDSGVWIQKNGKFGLFEIKKNKLPRELLPCLYDSMAQAAPKIPLWQLWQNGLTGIADRQGSFVVNMGNYEKIQVFDDFVEVKKPDTPSFFLHFLAGFGARATRADTLYYPFARPPTYNQIALGQGNYWAWANSNLVFKTEFVFGKPPIFRKNQVLVWYQGAMGLTDTSANWLLPPVYENLQIVSDSVFLAYQAGIFAILDKRANLIYQTSNKLSLTADKYIIEQTADSCAQLGMFDSLGCRIASPIFANVSVLVPDSLWLTTLHNESWGIVGRSGFVHLLPQSRYEQPAHFGGGYLGVRIKGKYGFVQHEGFKRISARYDSISAFSDRLAAVRLAGRWGYIDQKENLIIQPQFERALKFRNARAVVYKHNLCALIDSSGQLISNFIYQSIWPADFGFWQTSAKTVAGPKMLLGLLDVRGRVVFNPQYDSILMADPGFPVLISHNKKFGLKLWQNGVEPLPIRYKHIFWDANIKTWWVRNND